MAGIYIHVPFCKVKCHYCDFHFSTQLGYKDELVNALCIEISRRNDYLEKEEVETIYFGGGTPSILDSNQLNRIIQTIYQTHTVSPACEVTLECNPDDLSPEKLMDLHKSGVNRLSIGVQSFNDKVLEFMNRAHTGNQAIESIQRAQDIGFDNITMDLIYGVPDISTSQWEEELGRFANLNVPHLSAYCLTIEENTAFGKWFKQGKLTPLPDTESLAQFKSLIDFAQGHGYEHYEISNFAKPGFISRHNSAYWLGKKYLGIGPSAHSYNGIQREWNIANNLVYIKKINAKESCSEIEELSVSDRFNEYVLTRLRTKWGISLKDLSQIDLEMTGKLGNQLEHYVRSGDLIEKEGVYILGEQGKFIADAISADLFYLEED